MEWVEGGVMIWSDKMLIIVCCMKWICDRMNMTMLLDWMNDGIDVCNDGMIKCVIIGLICWWEVELRKGSTISTLV